MISNEQVVMQALVQAAGNLAALAALKAIANGHNDLVRLAREALRHTGAQQ